tara:strand:- start:978 stop:1355 length:378 start_codon:yes stop_codon:yes gene_type:complete
MNWKYGLIKIKHPSILDTLVDSESNFIINDDYCELVELYMSEDGKYNSFCKTRINSVEELIAAHNDIIKDGVNTWFAENGTFSLDKDSKSWNWELSKPLDDALASCGDLESYEDEIDLYAVYGGD